MSLTMYVIFCTMVTVAFGSQELDYRLNMQNKKDLAERKEATFNFTMEVISKEARCVNQYMGEKAKLKVAFKVLEGTSVSQDIVMKIWSPSGEEVKTMEGNVGKMELDLAEKDRYTPGTFKICVYNMDNIFRRQVDISIQLSGRNRTKSVPEDVQKNLDTSLLRESFGRLRNFLRIVHLRTRSIGQHVRTDFHTTESRRLSYVDHLGTMNCLAIIGMGLLQVYFVRKLFETTNIRDKNTATL